MRALHAAVVNWGVDGVALAIAAVVVPAVRVAATSASLKNSANIVVAHIVTVKAAALTHHSASAQEDTHRESTHSTLALRLADSAVALGKSGSNAERSEHDASGTHIC